MGAIDAEFGKPFLVQRLLPYKLVQLSSDAQLNKKKKLPARTFLFAVYQNDGKLAYCTVKDQSLGNVAKSLFIPALDKRPCLVDANDDGKFEASFGVFDKYGSALTPSGNLSSAKPLIEPVAYEQVMPSQFPAVRRFQYSLAGSKDPLKSRIEVGFSNSDVSNFTPMTGWSKDSVPGSPAALNIVAKINEVVGDKAQIDVSAAPDLYIVGDSGGTFGAEPLPDFVEKAK